MSSTESVSPFSFLHRNLPTSLRAGSLASETVYVNHPELLSQPHTEGMKKRVFKQERSPGVLHKDIACNRKLMRILQMNN